jgi:hypothetical protein
MQFLTPAQKWVFWSVVAGAFAGLLTSRGLPGLLSSGPLAEAGPPSFLVLLTGIPVGIVQWLVARRNLGIRIAWIPRTALGIAIVIFLPSLPDVVLVDFNVSLLRRALPFICVVHFLAGGIAGLGLGALQSLSAEGTPIADSPWIKFTVLGAALGSVVGLATFPDFYGVYSLYSNIAAVILDTARSALMWAAIGISQSYALRRSRPSTR